MTTWHCLKNCGACCYLAPDERPYLDEFLPPHLLKQYLELVAADGWCKNFDKTTRTCAIYETRPLFCRVSVEVLVELYGEDPQDLDDWAIHCCTEHILANPALTTQEARALVRQFSQK